MPRAAPILALLLAFAPVAASAGAADVAAARAELARQRGEVSALRERQHALRVELNVVGDRIAQLKAASSGKLLRQDALDAELKRSQALSAELTTLAARLSEADAATARARQAVVSALSEELAALRSRFEKTQDREARRGLIDQMRGVRQEREPLAAALPRAEGTAALSSASPDDPEDLLEQADALRDRRDKLQRRLVAVQRRVVELRQEQELERRLGEFVEEESLFDEHDRRLGRTPEGRGLATDVPESDPSPVTGADDFSGGAGGGGVTSPSPDRFRDPQPELGAPPPDDLRGLEAEAKRLSTQAAELETRARDAERRALELR